MEPPAAPLDTTPDPAIVQPPGASPPVPPREQQEQLRIGESGQFSEGLEDRGEQPPVPHRRPPSCALPSAAPCPTAPPSRPGAPDARLPQRFLHPHASPSSRRRSSPARPRSFSPGSPKPAAALPNAPTSPSPPDPLARPSPSGASPQTPASRGLRACRPRSPSARRWPPRRPRSFSPF